jgi:radical SAM protein with 4Fe4S-binding SPASM domain
MLPKNVGWSTGNYCNASCKHCYSVPVREARTALTKHEICHIVEQLKLLGVKTVNLGGNEPIFTNGPNPRLSSLPYMIEKLHNAEIIVGITTNGTTLLRLERHHPSTFKLINDWDISLDSPFEKEHNENRGLSCYQLALKALDLCTKYDIPKSIVYCATLWNTSPHHLEALLNLSDEHDANLRVNTLKPVDKRHLSMLLSVERYFYIFNYLLQRTDNLVIADPILSGLTGQNTEGCPCGHSSFRIHSKTNDGRVPVSPCVYLHRFAAGDLLTDNIMDIMESSSFQEIRQRTEVVPQSCHNLNCRQISACRGGCAAMAYLVGGSLEAIDPYCPELAKMKGIKLPKLPQCQTMHKDTLVHENYLCTWIGKHKCKNAEDVSKDSSLNLSSKYIVPPNGSVRDSSDAICCFRQIKGEGLRLIWEITNECNLRCQHCFVQRKKRSLLDTRECLKIIGEFSDLAVQKVMFTGGEPMLREDIYELICASAENGAEVDLVTNGLLVNRERARALHRSGLSEVTISLDGPPHIHEIIRRQYGTFDRTLHAIQAFLDEEVPVDIVCVVNRINIFHLFDLFKIALKLGCSSLNFSGIAERNLTQGLFDDLAFEPDLMDELEIELKKMREIAGNEMPVRTVALLKKPYPEMSCPNNRMISIDSSGKAKRCLLASSSNTVEPDIRLGLANALEKVDWSKHCGDYRWAHCNSECPSIKFRSVKN